MIFMSFCVGWLGNDDLRTFKIELMVDVVTVETFQIIFENFLKIIK